MGLFVSLILFCHLGQKALLLVNRIIEFGKGIGDLPSSDDQLKTVNQLRVVVVLA